MTKSASRYVIAGFVSLFALFSGSHRGSSTEVVSAQTGETVLLEDDFNGTVVDRGKWDVANLWSGTEDPAIAVQPVNQQLSIGPLSAGATASHFNGIASIHASNFTGGYAYVELLQPASTTGVTYTLFAVGIDNANYYRWSVSGTTLVAQRVLAATATELFAVPYDPTVHRFLKIRHDGTNAVFETAPGTNGVPGAWTTHTQTPWSAGITVTALRFEVKAGTRDPHPNPGTAVVDNFKAAVPTPTNQPPAVSLTSPATGSTFSAPATISLQATASDANGAVTQVEFYAGSSLIGTDTTAPYAFTWTGVSGGPYTLTAVARDNVGATTTSTPVAITVAAGAGERVLLEDDFNDGTVDRVKWDIANLWSGFEDATIPVAEVSGRLSIGALTVGGTGSHYNGLASVQAENFTGGYAQVELVQPPAATGVTYAMFALGIDSTHHVRWVVSGGVLLAQRTLPSGQTNLVSLPYDPVAHRFLKIRHDGTDAVFETAPGSGGVAGVWTTQTRTPWSASITVTALRFEMKSGTSNPHPNPGTALFDNFRAAVPVPNEAPDVAVTAPAAGETFVAPATIGLQATASDADGSIAEVSFYAGSTLIGTDTTSPFTYNWTNVAAGPYTLTAVARDNVGATTTSTPVAITVAAGAGERVLLEDDFNDGTVDRVKWDIANLWSGFEDATIPVTEVSGRLSIGALTVGGTGSHYNGLASVQAENFTGGYAQVELVQPPAATGVTYAMFALGIDSTHHVRWVVSGGVLLAQRTLPSGQTNLVSLPYDPVAHRFLKIRHDGTDAVFETAPGSGGVAGVWTTQTRTPWDASITMTALRFEMKSGTSNPHPNPGTALFDNFRAAVPVNTNRAPTVSLTAPAAQTTYSAPASVTLLATASDTDGTVTQVAFYVGATLIGTDTTAPYAYTWIGVGAGAYGLRAVARDNGGAEGSSITTGITVVPSAAEQSLVDGFDDNSLDTTKWTAGALITSAVDPQVAVREASQRLEIGPLRANTPAASYNGVTSARTWPFRDRYASVELATARTSIAPPPTAPTPAMTYGPELGTGTYVYKVVYETADGAMSVGPPSGPVTTTGIVQPPPGTNASNAKSGDPNAGGFNLQAGRRYSYRLSYAVGPYETLPGPATPFFTADGKGARLSRRELGFTSGPYDWKVYRTTGDGSTYQLVPDSALEDDFNFLYDVYTTDSQLGAQPPSSGTLMGNRVRLEGIPVSPSALVTRRHIYRTTVNGSAFRYAFTIADNSTAVAVDTVPDSALGAEPPIQAPADVTYAQFTVAADANNYYRISQNGNRLVCERRLAGVTDAICSPTYDAAAHRFVRIRHGAGSAIFETSPSGDVTSWVQLVSVPWDETRVPLSAVWFELKGGTAAAAPAPGRIYFDNFESGTGAGNPRPTLTLSSPAPGSTHVAGAAIAIAATATDADGIAHVELFADAQSLGRIPSPPYTTTWSTSTSGGHRIVAVATDTRGATASTGVDITVQAAGCTTLAAPTISPAAGSYSGSVSVSLASTSPGAVVRYTTTGTDPGASSPQYVQPIVLAPGTTTVRARAFLPNCSPSALVQATYQVTPANSCTTAPVMPVMSPGPGSYSGGVSVSLSTPTSGGVIRYTTDGSDPGESSAQYVQAITLSSTTTVRARTFVAGCSSSAPAQGTYTITASNNCSSVVTPMISPGAGTYSRSVTVTLATSTPGGVIRYTTDGFDPQAGSSLYTQGIILTSGTTTTVRARTFLGSCTPSGLAQATYQVVPPQTTTSPSFSPAPGLHARDTSITMGVADPFAIIRYTTDGSEPSESSLQYVGIPLRLTAPLTVKARAFRPDHDPSPTVSGAYTLQLPKPTMTPESGAYASSPIVSMSPDPSVTGVSLRYTTDGSDVTSTSTLYQAPFFGPFDNPVKVRAFKEGWVESEEINEVYWAVVIPVSPGVITPGNVVVNRLNNPSSHVMLNVSGATYSASASDWLGFRNGARIAVSPFNSTQLMLPSGTLVQGRNEIELLTLDASGQSLETTFTVWAGSNTLRVRAHTPSGAEFLTSAMTVRVILDEDPTLQLPGSVDPFGGFTYSLIPSGHTLTVTVSVPGYRTRVVPFRPTTGNDTLWVRLDLDNNDFSQDLNGWTVSAPTSNIGTQEHSEASIPLAICPDCLPRSAAAGAEAGTAGASSASGRGESTGAMAVAAAAGNFDLFVYTKNRFGTQFARRSFMVEEGTTKVSVRYRFQTAELLTPNSKNDSYEVRLTRNGGPFLSEAAFISQVRPTFDSNHATPWRTITMDAVPGDIITLDVNVTNAVDAAGPSWVYVDMVAQNALRIPEFDLYDHSNRLEPLVRLSASPVGPEIYNGRIRVNGTMTITGPADDSVSAVELEVLLKGTETVVARGALVAAAATALVGPFGSAGERRLATRQLMFEIDSAQFAGRGNDPNYNLRARVRLASGRTDVRWLGDSTPTGFARREVVRYAYTPLGSRRYGTSRDNGQCDAKVPQSCGGDGWALPSTHAFTQEAALSTFRFNDFSNINGGWFPDHLSHQFGNDMDVRFSDDSYRPRDKAAADKLIALLNSPSGTKIEMIFVTMNPFLRGYLAGKSVPAPNGGMRALANVIQNQPAHVEHFHIRLR